MSKKEEKITIKKKMSNRDYISLAYYLEDKEIPSFEGKDATYLAKVETRYMRVTREGKEKIDKFLNRFILGVSADALFNEVPDVKKPYVPPTQQILVQQALAQQVQAQQVPSLNNPSTDEPKYAATIISNDERWEWANADRTPNYDWDVQKRIDPKEVPFIIEHDKPISPDNTDFEMMMYMLEHGKISSTEAIAVFINNDAKKMIDLKPENIGLRDKYKNEANLYCAISQGEIIGKKYLDIMNEPEPSEDEILTRYKDYIRYSTDDVNDRLNECAECMEVITNISGNRIEFSTIEEDDEDSDLIETDYLEYETAEGLLTDLLHLSYTQKYKEQIDVNKKYNIFGKTISIKKFVADIYKKYPKGFVEGKVFYRTRREAYNEGALKL